MMRADDDLTRFLEEVHRHQIVNQERFSDSYRLMQRVNDCFVIAHQALVDPKPVLSGVLCLRSQYAYKAAACTVLAGQLGEAFAMMRLCLEHAGYALAIFAEPTENSTLSREQIFLNRHLDEASMKAQKREFRIINICPIIAQFDPSLGQIFQKFYDRTIDLGAHPNPVGVLNMAKIENPQANVSGGITALALTTEELPLQHAMKNTAQVGLTALRIFQHIFKEKFEALGIRAELDLLRKAL